MKHIRQYKFYHLNENLQMNSSYEKISNDEYILSDNINFNTKEVKNILGDIKNISNFEVEIVNDEGHNMSKKHLNTNNTDICNLYLIDLVNSSNPLEMFLYKGKDDYYYVQVGSINKLMDFYKCDQIDQVYGLINDKINEYK